MDPFERRQIIEDDYAFRAQCLKDGFDDPGMSPTLKAELDRVHGK